MWVGKNFTRNGCVTDARRSGAYCALKNRYTRVIATVDPRNTASRNTLSKAGFKLVHRLKKTSVSA
jgi:RimJ/RimL family protein N-acetyltransferase